MEPEITIHIYPASDEGFMYEVYLGDPGDAADADDSFDGGQCTTTIENAAQMAASAAVVTWHSRQDLPPNER